MISGMLGVRAGVRTGGSLQAFHATVEVGGAPISGVA